MKTLIPDSEKDIIATIYTRQVHEDGKPVWANQPEGIARVYNDVVEIRFMYPIQIGEQTVYVPVVLNKYEIQAVTRFIEQQKQIITDEFID